MPNQHESHGDKRRITARPLAKRLGCSIQTIWRWYTEGDFPKPHYLGQKRVWFESEIEAWERRKMAENTKPEAVQSRGNRNGHKDNGEFKAQDNAA